MIKTRLTPKQKGIWALIAVVVFIYALFPVVAIFANSFKTPALSLIHI